MIHLRMVVKQKLMLNEIHLTICEVCEKVYLHFKFIIIIDLYTNRGMHFLQESKVGILKQID